MSQIFMCYFDNKNKFSIELKVKHEILLRI